MITVAMVLGGNACCAGLRSPFLRTTAATPTNASRITWRTQILTVCHPFAYTNASVGVLRSSLQSWSLSRSLLQYVPATISLVFW
eukprot:2575325-Pleurochrysis_carterae.AAC.3